MEYFLKYGINGLILAALFLCYRLIAKEQKRRKPNLELLKTVKIYLFVLVGLVLVAVVSEIVTQQLTKSKDTYVLSNVDEEELRMCRESALRLRTFAETSDVDLETLRSHVQKSSATCAVSLGNIIDRANR